MRCHICNANPSPFQMLCGVCSGEIYPSITLGVEDVALAEQMGRTRQDHHAKLKNSTRRLNQADPYWEEIVGVKGEMAFEYYAGLPMDRELRGYGDGGMDFWFVVNNIKYKIDVKTAQNPIEIKVKSESIHRASDILVLAGFDKKTNTIWFVGWEEKRIIQAMPIVQNELYTNYIRGYEELRPMWQLKNIIDRRDLPK